MTNIAKYFLVGGICFLIDFTIFLFFAKILGYNYLVVNFFSFSIATLTNYALCILFVFQSGLKYGKKTELLLVFLVSTFSLVVNQSILFVLVSLFNLELLLSKSISIICTFLVNYFGRSTLVFGQKK